MKRIAASWGLVLALASPTYADLKEELKHVGSSEESIRIDAAFNLGEYKSPEAVAGLVKALNDTSAAVRVNAAVALYNIGAPLAKAAEPALRTALKDKDGVVRVNAAETLAHIGVPLGEVRPVVSVAMAVEDGRTRAEAAKVWLALKGSPADAVQAIAGAMRDSRQDVRESAMKVLFGIKALPADGFEVAKAATKDKYWSVRRYALDTLAHADAKRAPSHVPLYLDALRDGESLVRLSAVSALGESGAATPEVSAALVARLKDKESTVRSKTADALADLKLKDALPALQALAATEKDTFVKSSLRDAIAELGGK